MADQILTQARLKELLGYNPDTGEFIWRVNKNKIKRGQIAGTLHSLGYRHISIDNKIYKAHRLAWLYVYNKWPSNDIDHINRVKNDNRICNLRDVAKSTNLHNTGLRRDNTSGVKGVTWDKSRQKWMASIIIDRKLINLGRYNFVADAAQARKMAEIRLITR